MSNESIFMIDRLRMIVKKAFYILDLHIKIIF